MKTDLVTKLTTRILTVAALTAGIAGCAALAPGLTMSEDGSVVFGERWKVKETSTTMTGRVLYGTSSGAVYARPRLRSPWDRVTASLFVGCTAETDEWAYSVGLTDVLLDDHRAEAEAYGNGQHVKLGVIYDDDPGTLREEKFWLKRGDDSFWVVNTSEFRVELKRRESMTVEVPWYGQAAGLFRIPLKGAKAALEEMQEACD